MENLGKKHQKTENLGKTHRKTENLGKKHRKTENLGKNAEKRRIWPDWGNTTQADLAGLGSIGLR